MQVSIADSGFKDEHGRTRLFKGVNLGGSSKVPFRPDGATHRDAGFFDHRAVSFVGRPFPLEEADEHLGRLKSWGLTFLRFLITWEAVEHDGPGLYDEAYLDYLHAVVKKAGEYGFTLFIDPHQDVWSRFTGGDGAPGWTLEAVGFDMRNFKATGAAIVHATHGDPFPRMVWPSNYSKLACATMFTLFFGGNDFAPETSIHGEAAQEYLQRHYLGAMRQVVLRLKGMDHVLGYGTLNEPSAGFIGRPLDKVTGLLTLGDMPTPLQAMALGEGRGQKVGYWAYTVIGPRRYGSSRIDPEGTRAWLQGRPCVWRENGVWDFHGSGMPVALKPDHFRVVRGREIDFAEDYYKPFARRFTETIRHEEPKASIFIEGEANHRSPMWKEGDPQGIVSAPHWYDAMVLFLHRYSSFLGVDVWKEKPVIGLPRRIHRSFRDQVSIHRKDAETKLGGVPVVIGETGIAFNMENGRAYRSGNFRRQVKALDRIIRAMEALFFNYTLWNYTADNSNECGDNWNDEDFSIFSRDQQANPHDPDSGGRALDALLRPHPVAIPGEPLAWKYAYKRRVFEFSFRHDPEIMKPALFYIPKTCYPGGVVVSTSDGSTEVDLDAQTVIYLPAVLDMKLNRLDMKEDATVKRIRFSPA